jgi:hypothetical protein
MASSCRPRTGIIRRPRYENSLITEKFHNSMLKSATQTSDWLVVETVDGRFYTNTKRPLLEIGIVVLISTDSSPITFSAEQPECQELGRPRMKIKGGVIDPVLLVIARRYWDSLNSDNFKDGWKVQIPDRETAMNEINNNDHWPKPEVRL